MGDCYNCKRGSNIYSKGVSVTDYVAMLVYIGKDSTTPDPSLQTPYFAVEKGSYSPKGKGPYVTVNDIAGASRPNDAQPAYLPQGYKTKKDSRR